jgi:hypothetical protein
MKYVVTQDEDGKEELFMFPKSVNHDVFANAVSRLKNQSHGNWKRIDRDVIAAGFISYDYGIMSCHGRSETLNLDSRGRLDEMLIGD